MAWLQDDNLLSIWCRGLLTGATAFSSQSPAPSSQPSGPSPTIPQSIGIALSPGPQSVCCSIQIPLSGNYWRTCFSLTIPSRRFEAFYKMSQPVPFVIGLMGWGPTQCLWQMGCPWGLPFPPQLPLTLPHPPPLLLSPLLLH